MENRTQRILLTSALLASLSLGMSASALAVEGDSSENDERPLIEPDVEPRGVKESSIDTENFELGFMTGQISVEDFEVPWFLGLRGAYHLTEYLFVEGNLGYADAGETSFERLGGGVQILEDDERSYFYYNIGLGVNLLPGEAFFGKNYAFNTNFYLVGGMGTTEFAGDSRLTLNYGAGYQLLFNDWLAMHLQMRTYMYDIDLLGEEKTATDIQFATGMSMFF
ncbi:MAG: outer membrane beta-barrel domain-containing protein [Hahellaceae bacterium]|nr:outer membrane beta-barrel domain-containing protein [Hahellaceae bacterium]